MPAAHHRRGSILRSVLMIPTAVRIFAGEPMQSHDLRDEVTEASGRRPTMGDRRHRWALRIPEVSLLALTGFESTCNQEFNWACHTNQFNSVCYSGDHSICPRFAHDISIHEVDGSPISTMDENR